MWSSSRILLHCPYKSWTINKSLGDLCQKSRFPHLIYSAKYIHRTAQLLNEKDGPFSSENNYLPYDERLVVNTTCPPLAKPLNLPHDDPLVRSLNALGIKGPGAKDPTYDQRVGFPRHCDILIVGGGVIGCSVAYWIQQRVQQALKIVVVERDPTYTRASTVLSVGGLRQQFSLPENIQMSLFGAEFLRKSKQLLAVEGRDPPDVQFHPHGYLFLATEKGAQQLTENYRLQIELGARVELLTARKLKARFPWINTTNIHLACLGLENEGWFDPWSLLEGFKNKALSLGVTFIRGEVTGFETRELSVAGGGPVPHSYEKPVKVQIRLENGDYRVLEFSQCVVAAGPQSGEVAKLLGIGRGTGLMKYPLPVEPRKRYVYCFHAPDGPGLDCPLTVDTSGSYFREGLGGHYLAGKSPAPTEEPGITNLDVDYTFFDQQVWPDIANRVPGFENIKLKSAWAGYYDYNTLDQNAIIGKHPYHSNVVFATGFSGHGIQQAPAAGRAVMELLLEGGFLTTELSRFGFRRVITNEPIYEQNIV